MSDEIKEKPKINYIFPIVLWLLAVLAFLTNIIGIWSLWHLAGFGTIFYCPVAFVFQIRSIVHSFKTKDVKTIIINFLFLAISMALVLFTVFVSSEWFW